MASLRTRTLLALLHLSLWWNKCLAQVQLVNVTLPANSSITDTCIEVINQSVTCDSVLATLGDYDIFGISYFLTSDQLTALCTTTCTSALATWERRITGACGSGLWYQDDGSQAAPVTFAELYVEQYNSACLKGSDGSYCNSALANVLGIDASNGQSTASAASTAVCNSCYLSLLQTQLEMPLASNTEIASLLTAATSSCGSTGYSPTPTPSATTYTLSATTSSSATTSTCSGTTVALSSSSTCLGVSAAYGISTYDLLQQNGLPSLCYDFPTSGSLCIPETYKCETYVVEANDTCNSIMGEYGIIFSQIVGWNPPLGPACGNIASYVGFAICVSVPGGAWVNPSPSAVTTTTTAGFSTWSSLTAATLLPTAFDYTANASAYNLTSPALPAPYANGTRLDCTLYATAPVLTNSSSNATTLACQDVADLYGIALADLVGWNPSLNASDPCTMAEDTQYCVQLVQNTADNITSACVGWDTAPAGYDCIDFVSLFGLDLAEFIAWNLGVGDDCTNFTTGTSYCTSVAHFRQAGIVSTCNLYVMPNDTNWVDDPCQIIETTYGISHARFVAWNPAVGDDCSGLSLGYDYCVSIPNYKPTYTTPSSTGLGTPWYPSSFFSGSVTASDVEGPMSTDSGQVISVSSSAGPVLATGTARSTGATSSFASISAAVTASSAAGS